MTTSGILHKLSKKWLDYSHRCTFQDSSIHPSLGLQKVTLSFVIFSGGVIGSLVILFIESFLWKDGQRNRRMRRIQERRMANIKSVAFQIP